MKKLLILALAFAFTLHPAWFRASKWETATAQSQSPDQAERDNFLVETKEFLRTYVLPDIEKEIAIYTKAGLPPPPELADILTIGRNAETVEDLEFFDRAVRHYMENGPTLPVLTEEQVRTIAEGFGDILQRMASSGLQTGDIRKLLSAAKTTEDIRRFFAALASLVKSPSLSPTGEPVAPSLVVAGQDEEAKDTKDSKEAKEGTFEPESEPEVVLSVELSDLGSFEEATTTIQIFVSALSKAGASVRDIDRRIREAESTDDLQSLTSDLSAAARAFPFGTLSAEALLIAGKRQLQLLQSNVAHLSAVSPLPLSDITAKLNALEAELLLLEGSPAPDENGKSTELFLSHLRATLQEIFGFSPATLPDPSVEDTQAELSSVLSDLQDLLQTTTTGTDDRSLLDEALRATAVPEGGFATFAEMEEWFSKNERHVGTIRRVLPSPPLVDVRNDLATVLDALEQHLSTLDGTAMNREQLESNLQQLRSSLESLTTEGAFDQWFASFDAFFSSLTADES